MTAAANFASLAVHLAGARRATFSGIITQLQGKTVGPKGNKVVYGNALVHDVVVTGFSYTRLKERDLAILTKLTDQDLQGLLDKHAPLCWSGKGAKAVQGPLTLADLRAALADMIDSAQKSADGTNSATHDHVYRPLVVDGEVVAGARVYVGPDPASGKEPAAPMGTIYLQGLRIARKVIEEPVNGWAPAPKSGAPATAKELITKAFELPSRRYVSYRLEGDYILALGGQAAVAADDAGLTADPALVSEVRLALVG